MTQGSSSLTKNAALTDTVLRIVAERGLDQVSVRKIAAVANVSIGTVQHYFPTKDRMLAAAYAEVVARIRSRLQGVRLGDDTRQNLLAVLVELLPLDERRVAECRVHLAFAARAATASGLAQSQGAALTDIHRSVTEAFESAWGGRVPRATCSLAAHAAIAIGDGLALHAVSSAGWLTRRKQTATLKLALDALLSIGPPASTPGRPSG